MADPSAKSGPLTSAELQAIWESAVDRSYSEPIEAAGEGRGFEVYTQAFAQYARASLAIDVTTQAMFIRPWSGQTNPSAQGGNAATVTLALSRALRIGSPLHLAPGDLAIDEQTTDFGPDGPVVVNTGRRYVLTQDVVFMPGDPGPLNATFTAEKPGYGYNNPLPGTIVAIEQPGTGYENTQATVLVAGGTVPPPPSTVVTLVAANVADMFVPEHVGQVVLFTAGANAGLLARISSFIPPGTTAPNTGSAVGLEVLVVIESFFGTTGTFTPGELVQVKSGATVVGVGSLLAVTHLAGGHARVAFTLLSGTVTPGNTLLGQLAGATTTVSIVLADPVFTAEAPPLGGGPGGASWRVLDWAGDLGLSSTNVLSPEGGTSAMLDELGSERNVHRAAGEDDVSYSKRVWRVSDTTSPNAVKRALNRALNAIPWCFRETESVLLPGFYYDRLNDASGDFYDDDVIILTGTMAAGPSFVDPQSAGGFQEPAQFRDSTGAAKAVGWFGRLDGGTTLTLIRRGRGQGSPGIPVVVASGDTVNGIASGAQFNVTGFVANPFADSRRWHVYLDYLEFRAFFLVGVPPLGAGEFGFAYDAGRSDAYDAAPYDAFYDGFPYEDGVVYRRAYQAVDRVRAGGVGFELYLERGICT